MVGRPLSCDEHTFSCKRLDFARLCVEVDVAHPFVHSFEMDTPLSKDPIKPRSTTEASSSGVKQALAAAPQGAIACMERKLDSPQSQNSGDPSSEPQEFVADSATTTDNDVIGCWNAWGLNSLRKQMAVRNWTQNNGLGIIGLIEPRLGVNSISEKIAGMGLQGWNFVDSESHPPRLLVGWDAGKYSLQVIDKSPQWITCEVTGVGA
ncbi:hypothetical protein OIU78_016868 [Salix suchowensis]|nr:hypothetical protein OIU78_016868 [Salix suchowensis]